MSLKVLDLVTLALIGYLIWLGPAYPGRLRDADALLRVMDEVHYGIPESTRKEIAAAIVRHVPAEYRMVMLSLAYYESSWRPAVVGDEGQSFGLYQLRRIALEDVRRNLDPGFPVPIRWKELVLSDVSYATEGAWKYLKLNLESPARAAGDLALAVAMHRTGPDVGRARSYRRQAELIINTAKNWETQVGWNRLK